METVGEEEKGRKNSKMVNISLPLLFAEGKPTSLDRMTIGQMEKFIPFLLSCCPTASRETPDWWPRSIPFQFPLCSTGTLVEWETILKQTIARCYEHYNFTHLLRFCRRLSELPEHMLMYKESSPGFISIINSSNKKLIVTYKKKNETYDRPHSSPFKSLLPKKRKPTPQQPIIEDIYLCNYCDGEFFSCREIVAHEGVCSGKNDDDGVEALDQVSAMKYFMLQPRTLTAGTSVRRCTSLKLTAKSYMQIPISSPLGFKMFANASPLNNDDKMMCLTRIENSCKKQQENESFNKKKRGSAYAFRYAPKRKPMIWSHSYAFNKAQRYEKLLTLKTGLNKKARLMLQKCKEAIVLVERLPLLDPLALHAAASLNFPIHFPCDDSKERVFEVPPPEPPSTICIDLTCDDESSGNEYSSSSSDTFFLTSTSNHKIPSVEDWMPSFPKPLVHV